MKFIHTADWHLDNNFSQFSREKNQELNRARFSAVRAIFIYADKNNIPLIICAGDQIDSSDLRNEKIIVELFSIINNYKHIKIIMIAGNHDALCSQNIYSRIEKKSYPENLIFINDKEVLEFPEFNCKIFASSLKDKNNTHNPLEWIDDKNENMIRIGAAHGSLKIPGKFKKDDFPIDTDFAVKKHLDYLALGHWHSFYKFDDFTYYPGTPEPLQFKDNGYSLKVTINKKGDIPNIEKINVSQYRWDLETIKINNSSDINLFIEKYRKDSSLKKINKVTLEGNLSINDFNKLNAEIEELQYKYFQLQINNNISFIPTEEEIQNSIPEGYIKNIADKLIKIRNSSDNELLADINDEDIIKEEIINHSLLKIFNYFSDREK